MLNKGKNYITLYHLISHNQHLQDRRHPLFEKNRVMKVLGILFMAFWAIYLMCIGVTMYSLFANRILEAYDYIDGGLFIFLLLDFLLRFILQDTPAQNVKQYKLLNIDSLFLLHIFLLRIGLRLYNFLWFFFFIPFGILAIPRYFGIIGLVGFLVGWWLIFVLNAYWYLLWRTFINKKIQYILIPISLYIIAIYLSNFHTVCQFSLFSFNAWLMRGFINWQIPSFLCFVFSAIPLYFINVYYQKEAIFTEISRLDDIHNPTTYHYKFFDRLGFIGEYLKLEIRSIIRNKVVRRQFLNGFGCMIILCCLFAFTDIYDEFSFMRTFICVYSFSCLGAILLTNIMRAEGNYIDGLMMKRQSVISLLKAKYIFVCALMIIPLGFTMLPMTKGKIDIIDILGCMLFTSGCIYPFLFFLATINDSTMSLNENIIKRARDSKTQLIFSLSALFVPLILMESLISVFSQHIACIIMTILGLIGTLASPFWIKAIYRRFTERKYQLLSGFRETN